MTDDITTVTIAILNPLSLKVSNPAIFSGVCTKHDSWCFFSLVGWNIRGINI